MTELVHEAARLGAALAAQLSREAEPPVCLAVVDGEGALVYLYRMADAPARLVTIATAKAYTAVRMAQPTKTFRQRLLREGLALADFQDGGLTSLPGGWPVRQKGRCVAGLAISGRTLDEDERLCRRWHDSLVNDLSQSEVNVVVS
ncbi:GlcG/HbpS family heme-binding protein [Oceanimonas baumannii]|uniref:GlcG/HbpS family heme-binding protein n=1 Tax=Oceanimonas baumannii TaxID=129578 RepID=UPI003A925325